ncbi:hypothetical protein [Streptococcus hyointestinalis]
MEVRDEKTKIAVVQYYAFTGFMFGLIPAVAVGTYKGIHLDLSKSLSSIFTILIFGGCVCCLLGLAITELSSKKKISNKRYGIALVKFILFYAFFVFADGYLEKHGSSAALKLLSDLFIYWGVGWSFLLVTKTILPNIYEWYLMKHVLNKGYLGYRTFNEPVAHPNIFSDLDNVGEDIDYLKRIEVINKRAIQEPYVNIIKVDRLVHEIAVSPNYQPYPFLQLLNCQVVHLDLRVTITKKKRTLYDFKLISLDIDKRDALIVVGQRPVDRKERKYPM